MYPRYTYPWRTVLGLSRQVLAGGQRSFRADACACLDRLTPPMRIFGAEHIPAAGPVLVTVNHYSRRGFNAWWIALAIASVVPKEMHWTITGELTFPGKWYAPLGQAGSRWLLRRVARVYGFTTMPPMPPRPDDVAQRALAVQRVLRYARQHTDAILGLAPEGMDNPVLVANGRNRGMDLPGGMLGRPPQGVGRFITLLAGLGFRLTPAGVYEQDGLFCLRFGPTYALRVPAGCAAAERDRLAAQVVMGAIARLLPPRLRGEFT